MERYTENISGDIFDVLIIGGGITGASVAYEAASRGLSVVLLEKGDFSAATSAASSKLIHGGLRYLVNMEYGLVRESLRERKNMTNIAPNFVYPFPMLFPHYRSSLKSNKWFIRIGLIQYDLLAAGERRLWDKSKSIPRHRALSAEKALRLQPTITRKRLSGASLFYDCISICPERLALAFVKSAMHYGARAANYARVTGFLLEHGRVIGVRVRDVIHEKAFEIKGRVTLNCAGPWVDDLLSQLFRKRPVEHLERSQGIHIITRQLTEETAILSAITPIGRHCFLIPWRGHTLIGTTDKPYRGHPDNYRVTRESILELIEAVNTTFEGVNLTYEDVLCAYGGLRPLLGGGKKETYRSSRKYEIHDSAVDGISGLLTVEGGKWTTSRGLAEKVVDRLMKRTRLSVGPSVSGRQWLRGSEIDDMRAFLGRIKRENSDVPEKTLDCLGRLYGREYRNVLDILRQERISSTPLNGDGEVLAQVIYGVRHEMARSLNDIVLRRTGIGTLGNPGKEILLQVARVMGEELNWDDKKVLAEVDRTSNFLEIP